MRPASRVRAAVSRMVLRMKMSALFRTAVIAAALMVLLTAAAAAQIRQEHPRIWLSPEMKATLVDRLNRDTQQARILTGWCANHMNDDLSGYINNRATSLLQALNYALLYQLQGNTSYAARAVEIIEYAFEHPYSNYTIDAWVEFDNYYNTRYLVPAVAITLDWCWDNMTQTQRDRFVAQLDNWCSNIMNAQPWSWRDPSNNYYFGHLWALMTSGYAMYGHNSNASSYLAEARDVMLAEGIKYTTGEQIAWPLWDNRTGRADGGIWNEGTSYGQVNNEFICSAILAVRHAEDPDYAAGFQFANDAINYYIYGTYPNDNYRYSDGDGATTGAIDATIRIPVVFCTALAGGDTKSYGKYWIDSHTEAVTWGYKMYNDFIWYDDQVQAVNYKQDLGQDYYYANGVQTLFWRSDWTQDATWVMMKLGLLNTDHAHNGIGHFIVYRNGYLIADKAAVTRQSMLHSDADHNVLFIQPVDDRKLYWGHSDLEHLENTADYLYLAGDLTGPYTAQPDYRQNRVAHREREFFLLKSDQSLVIMDRARTFDSAVDKVFRAYMENTPSSEGEGYRVTNGTWDLVLKPAWPSTASASLGSSGIPLVSVSSPGDYAEKTFVNVMRVDQRGGSLNTAQLQISDPAFAGAAFQAGSGTLDYVTVFSNDIEGDIPQFDRVTLSYNYYSLAVRVFVMNLAPSTTYYFANSESGGMIDVTLSTSALGSGGSATTSAEGVLSFFVYPGEDPQPLTPPAGIRID